MSRFTGRLVGSAITLLLVGVSTLDAQRPHTREGFWANLGAGWASLGCDDCSSRESGTAGALALGGTLSQKWQLGGGVHVWTKSEDGATLTVGLVSAMARFYPSATGGFHLIGGLGVASIDLSYGSLSERETGTGVILGLGYDFRVGRNISISPFWNGVGSQYDGGDLNFGQLGVGITFH